MSRKGFLKGFLDYFAKKPEQHKEIEKVARAGTINPERKAPKEASFDSPMDQQYLQKLYKLTDSIQSVRGTDTRYDNQSSEIIKGLRRKQELNRTFMTSELSGNETQKGQNEPDALALTKINSLLDQLCLLREKRKKGELAEITDDQVFNSMSNSFNIRPETIKAVYRLHITNPNQ